MPYTVISTDVEEHTLVFWEWKQYILAKHWYLSTKLHGVTSHQQNDVETRML